MTAPSIIDDRSSANQAQSVEAILAEMGWDNSIIADPDDHQDFLDRADAKVTDGTETVYRYEALEAGCRLYYHANSMGHALSTLTLTDASTGWAGYFRGWDYSDFAELLAGFSLDASAGLDEADEDYTGEVRIWVAKNYYAGTLGSETCDRWLCDEDHDVRTFASVAEAQAWVAEVESAPYVLAHGEAGRPQYTICKA